MVGSTWGVSPLNGQVPPKRPWRAAGTAREAQASMVSTKNESEDPDEFRYIEVLIAEDPQEIYLTSLFVGI